MKKNIVKLAILVCSSVIAVFSINAAIEKHKKPDLKRILDSGEIELLENAIIIDSLSEETDSENYKTLKESFEEVEDNVGQILFVDNLLDENSSNIDIKKDKNNQSFSSSTILQNLRKKDDRWHYSYYKIKKGDNLWIIAKKFNIDHKLLIQVNNINNPKMLKAGKTLKIPNKNGIYYKIKKGDTLSEICSKYKIDLKTAAQHNNIKLNKIIIGKKIFLPDARKIIKPKPIAKKTNIKHSVIVKNKKSDKAIANNTKNPKVKSSKTFYWPLKGRITSGFGIRKHPISKTRKFHCGIDIGAVKGTSVIAAKKGKIIYSGWKDGYGKLIVIEHDNNYISVYAHLSKLLVKKGDEVKLKEKIALSGATGLVTGPHLHFEIRKYLTPLNPMKFLR